ncbi:MAG: noncanonical pyrimidine nucleotidase, YjjG family [Bacteroidetes bacterium]|nr:noncanonical pyrimidine nucleotidase, YjjG family [Bacteroidota bacterium]|tara:strand:- start:18 stop:710 length:693 start_codon:yes stop_codon:yes gene_type:complete
MKYKHIFFDLDRTLWDFEKSAEETFLEMYEVNGLKKKGVNSFEEFRTVYKKHNDQLWAQYRKGEIEKEVLSVQRFVLTLAEFGINDMDLSKKLGNEYITLSPLKTNLFPYTHEILQYLQEKYELHLITNGFEEVQQVKVDASDLRKYFKNLITSEEAGHKKPDARIFQYAFDKASTNASESIMIGDDLKVDILGAKAIGMDQIYVNFTNYEHCQVITHEVDSLEKIKEIL